MFSKPQHNLFCSSNLILKKTFAMNAFQLFEKCTRNRSRRHDVWLYAFQKQKKKIMIENKKRKELTNNPWPCIFGGQHVYHVARLLLHSPRSNAQHRIPVLPPKQTHVFSRFFFYHFLMHFDFFCRWITPLCWRVYSFVWLVLFF